MRALPALYAGYAHAYCVFVNIKSAKLVRLGVIIGEKFAFYTVGEVKFGLSQKANRLTNVWSSLSKLS